MLNSPLTLYPEVESNQSKCKIVFLDYISYLNTELQELDMHVEIMDSKILDDEMQLVDDTSNYQSLIIFDGVDVVDYFVFDEFNINAFYMFDEFFKSVISYYCTSKEKTYQSSFRPFELLTNKTLNKDGTLNRRVEHINAFKEKFFNRHRKYKRLQH